MCILEKTLNNYDTTKNHKQCLPGYCFFLLWILNGSCEFIHEENGEVYPSFINTESHTPVQYPVSTNATLPARIHRNAGCRLYHPVP